MHGTITKIEKQKRNKSRFNIYIDHTYAASVHEDVLVRLQLTKGQYIEADDWREVLRQEETERAKQAAIKYVSYKPRTAFEVERYLNEKGHASSHVTAVLQYLQKYNYVDDEAFARSWVEERRRLKGKGRYALEQELRQKGIPEHFIAQALATIDSDSEEALAREWALKRYGRVKHLPWPQVERRIGAFLGRRGFSYDHILAVLHELRSEHSACKESSED